MAAATAILAIAPDPARGRSDILKHLKRRLARPRCKEPKSRRNRKPKLEIHHDLPAFTKS
jgi:hypothetical protein